VNKKDRGGVPRRHLGRRHDRRLLPLRHELPRPRRDPHHQRGQGRQPGGLRRDQQAAGDESSGESGEVPRRQRALYWPLGAPHWCTRPSRASPASARRTALISASSSISVAYRAYRPRQPLPRGPWLRTLPEVSSRRHLPAVDPAGGCWRNASCPWRRRLGVAGRDAGLGRTHGLRRPELRTHPDPCIIRLKRA
jgi:hypothetical protein